jgi:hypothetical protein
MPTEQCPEPYAFLAGREFEQAISSIAVSVVETGARNDARNLKFGKR